MRTSIFFVLVLFVFTACSVSPKPAQKATPASIFAQLFTQSVWRVQGEWIRFKEGRFARYKSVDSAPVDFGAVTLRDTRICLEGWINHRCYQTTQEAHEIVLYEGNQTSILVPHEHAVTFYAPQTLFEAAHFGYKEDLNAIEGSYSRVNNEGSYPLIEAIKAKNYALIAPMIASGADFFSQNFEGYTALDMALLHDDVQALELLLAHGANVQFRPCGELLERVLDPLKIPMIIRLIEAGFNPSCQQSALLFMALEARANDFLAFLFDHGVKTDAVSWERGDTPLMRAAAIGDEKQLKILLSYGVNIHAQDSYAQTALDYDSKYLPQKNPLIAPMLRRAGLTTGLIVQKDQAFAHGTKLFEQKETLGAFKWWASSALKYQEARFYDAALKAYEALPTSDTTMARQAVALLDVVLDSHDEAFYEKAVSYYEKTLIATHTHQVTVRTIDDYLNAWLEINQSTTVWERKLQNLRRLGTQAPMMRMDSTQGTKRYVGEGIDLIPLGLGTLSFDTGARYTGDVINWTRHGQGKMLYGDGSMYDGTWYEDKRHGKGFFTQSDDTMYLGTFVEDILQGTPIIVRSSNNTKSLK